jgi:hypothetical protein
VIILPLALIFGVAIAVVSESIYKPDFLPELSFPAILLVAVPYYWSVYVRPAINREAKVALRKVLRDAAHTIKEIPQRIGGAVAGVVGI